ncbi:universal stress protein [Psychroserpens sp.]|uniref:universal stress protein n=1 Tax=Psychroserpens sp. TaxID=2020870 RepID=UPI001B1DEDCF|nr:universal stress protein [Psychroserpens sp.]MBO6607814.1 universal stress protein [Psychroserpens sp.]MBO6630854.1 universal stress protein [Psychroserpens sp.]MBO6654805.1 universal stress protein [Psychroserpens sp.]MBO6682771.1 universal stress protein [Psychroserpens sp.]MBO6751172.1 universal stress protein [Psychroserpens sp.]
MKKILVPTDFSQEAEHAIKVASQIAKKHGSEIYLLHMLEIPMQEIDAVSSQAEVPEVMFFMKMAHQKFEDIKNSEHLDGLTVHEIVKPDGSFNGISEICKEHNISMITMGSHGASGIKEMFVGSNAEKAVRNSDVPVLVIKNDHDDFSIDDVVFASDFKNDNKETYRQATELATAFGAQLHLLMVNTASNFTTTQKANDRINDFIADYSFKNYTITIYNDESVEKGILNFSRQIDADLIGISTHGRQGIAHFFNGSISEDLVNHANRPVITFKI